MGDDAGNIWPRSAEIDQENFSSERRLLDLAKRIYQSRRKRDAKLPRRLFGEPSWDLLLDLFISAASGQPVRVSSACIASLIPTSTGLRWLAILMQEGLVEPVKAVADDELDPHVKLSAKGLELMRDLLREIGAS